jgi:hypothetical protein
MKTKQYNESLVKSGYIGHASMFYQVGLFKFKFTYEHGNSFERFKIEQYDGNQLNYIANLLELNEKRNGSAYHMDEVELKNRVAELNIKARKYVETLTEM